MVPVGIYIFWVRDRDQGLPARRDQGLLLSVAPHTVEQPRGTMTNTLSRWETAGTQQTHAPLEPVSPPHSVQVLCQGSHPVRRVPELRFIQCCGLLPGIFCSVYTQLINQGSIFTSNRATSFTNHLIRLPGERS